MRTTLAVFLLFLCGYLLRFSGTHPRPLPRRFGHKAPRPWLVLNLVANLVVNLVVNSDKRKAGSSYDEVHDEVHAYGLECTLRGRDPIHDSPQSDEWPVPPQMPAG